jgi:hypothetical protein
MRDSSGLSAGMASRRETGPRRRHDARLYHTHTGRLLIITGLVMMLVGSAILKKIVSFRG